MFRFHGLHHDFECSGRQGASFEMLLLFTGTRGCHNEGFEAGMEILHPEDEALCLFHLVSGMLW